MICIVLLEDEDEDGDEEAADEEDEGEEGDDGEEEDEDDLGLEAVYKDNLDVWNTDFLMCDFLFIFVIFIDFIKSRRKVKAMIMMAKGKRKMKKMVLMTKKRKKKMVRMEYYYLQKSVIVTSYYSYASLYTYELETSRFLIPFYLFVESIVRGKKRKHEEEDEGE